MAQQHLIRVMMSQEPSGSQGKPDPALLQRKKEMKRMTDAYVKDEKDEKTGWKKANDFMRKNLGINFGISAILKQSQIFTSFIGTIFQLMGALVDVILYPFIPVVLPIIRGIGWLIPKIHEVMSKHVAPFIQNLMNTTAGIFKWVFNFFTNPSWTGLAEGIAAAIKAALGLGEKDKDGVNGDNRQGLTVLTGIVTKYGIHETAKQSAKIAIRATSSLIPKWVKSTLGIIRSTGITGLTEADQGAVPPPSLKERAYGRSSQLSKQFMGSKPVSAVVKNIPKFSWLRFLRGKGGAILAPAFSLWDAISAFNEGGFDGLVVAHLIKAAGMAALVARYGALGFSTGAAIGSVVPGPGTAVGGFIGLIAGLIALGFIDVKGKQFIDESFKQSTINAAQGNDNWINKSLTQDRRNIIIEIHTADGTSIDRFEKEIIDDATAEQRYWYEQDNRLGVGGW
tara:strand:+ start:1153 stop:2508 length:1356 start_codon:yes stop_codon:yes gene_type:complete